MSLKVNAYVSDGSVLLAFDMPQPADDFAGFAIQCFPNGDKPYYLQNRLSLTKGVSKSTKPTNPWTDSNKAPFQKFYWMHFPPTVDHIRKYDYEVTAMHYDGKSGLKAGEKQRISVDFDEFCNQYKKFRPGFTRGYIASQAYATEFKNALIRPDVKKGQKKQMLFDTKKYEKQWAWLGYTARQLVFNFLNDCLKDKSIHVDLFAYDLDEPDFIRGIVELGKQGRLRAFLDNADLHTKTGAVEIDAHKAILAAAGSHNVVQGCFKRFAHCKVMVARRNGQPFKVFTGSANFSVRGLYVQANNCIVIDDPKTAKAYGDAFDEAFTQQQKLKSSAKTATAFAKSPIAAKYVDCSGPDLPKFEVAFSPHTSESVSLDAVAQAIKNAKSSVIFAVMQLGGSGTVLQQLGTLNQRKDIFAYGMTQNAGAGDEDSKPKGKATGKAKKPSGITLFAPGSAQHGQFAAFSFLNQHVPPPFDKEYSGGMGQTIHNKFVVVDFNGEDPVVFTGSSNLAKGGEVANGDSLLAIRDRNTAIGYAIEGIRLVDHYHFRMLQAQHPSSKPITLQQAGDKAKKWWTPYYDPKDTKYTERVLFAQGHHAAVAHGASAAHHAAGKKK